MMIRCSKCGVSYKGNDPERFFSMHANLKGLCRPKARRRDIAEKLEYWEGEKRANDLAIWNSQKEPCTGSGYSHKAHGACPGWSQDRT